jgi:universal stress protein A
MKVLLAVDDSKHSEDAVKGVAHFFKPKATEVRIVQVLPPMVISAPPQMSRGYAPELEESVKDARALVDKYAKQLRTEGFQVNFVVERGNVRESIIDCAAGWHADVILLGSGGHKGVGRLLLGSVAESVVRHAHCSVLVVRPAARE